MTVIHMEGENFKNVLPVKIVFFKEKSAGYLENINIKLDGRNWIKKLYCLS